ncbi:MULTISPECIES: hypothetical protein [Kitasatospora]|uniref:Uncharacterized protein n=1 Tax=Kitasatospora setae (strain ATCC 33774 / DSM 43861 / JCM 3304 / KCC A-0304 / NBRC 14216 / KM-6054) TaxID=452652 RepID=E4NG60_KITSK|nr:MULTISPECIES: hypothetical protein [Kitasatospora]BAJ30490.1 hypothetical protein KSE_47100 [Kitasatospora setae KM-6054]
MTSFLISNEAGSAGRAFTVRAEEALYAAAPRIVELSALPLPDEVTVRLVRPGAVPGITRGHFTIVGRMVSAEFEAEEHRAAALKLAATQGAITGLMTRLCWPLIGGQMVLGPVGPELLVVHRMHAGNRTSQRALTQTLGHELVHAAEFLRFPGLVPMWVRQMVEARIGRRPARDVLPVPEVSEGHAMWVHRRLVAELGGVEDHFPGDPKAKLRFRALRRVAEFLPIVPDRSLYLRGQQFMSALHDAGGPAMLSSIFDGEDTVPTSAELDSPALWLARHRAEASPPPAA